MEYPVKQGENQYFASLADAIAQPIEDEMTQQDKIMTAYDLASAVIEALEFAKPNDRSQQDRAIAIALTDAQKLLAWIKVYCIE